MPCEGGGYVPDTETGTCLKLYSIDVTGGEAKVQCENDGATMTKINSLGRQNFVENYLQSFGELIPVWHCHLGLLL